MSVNEWVSSRPRCDMIDGLLAKIIGLAFWFCMGLRGTYLNQLTETGWTLVVFYVFVLDRMGKFKNDKPKWKKSAREKKAEKYKNYIGNKAEGQGFADIRKKKILSEYRQVLTEEAKSLKEWSKKVQQIYKEETSDEESNKDVEASDHGNERKSHTSKQKNQVKGKTKVSIFHKEAKELEKSRQLKEQKRQDRERKQKEREEALERYRKNKEKTYNVYKKTNCKGQPYMGARVKLLLDKIEMTNSTK